MDARTLLDVMEVTRSITLQTVESIHEEEADIQPEGFNNTIRWNLGHIYLVQERLAFHHAGYPVDVPQSYIDWFANGTNPSDWKGQAPQLAELFCRLQEQPKRIRTLLGEKLHEPLDVPFNRYGGRFNSIGAIIGFSLFHEGQHVGAIKLLKQRIVK